MIWKEWWFWKRLQTHTYMEPNIFKMMFKTFWKYASVLFVQQNCECFLCRVMGCAMVVISIAFKAVSFHFCQIWFSISYFSDCTCSLTEVFPRRKAGWGHGGARTIGPCSLSISLANKNISLLGTVFYYTPI